MKLLMGAMCRTGMNAIGRWLLRQSSLKDHELKYVHGDWVEYYSGYMYMTMINHPEHRPIHRAIIDEYMPGNIIMTVERDSWEGFKYYRQLYPGFNHVIILREFKNWVASVCQMHGSLHFGKLLHADVVKYKSLLEDKDCLRIKYDQWCTDLAYRYNLCNILGLKFTDCGFEDVSPNGDGSSFDGLKFQGRASNMNTTERYKKVEHMRGFQNILKKYNDILELSDEVFK